MTIRVGVSSKSKIKVTTRISTPESLSGIDNVNIDNIKDGYILMYDDNLKRYTFVDPDTFFSKASENNNIPQEFVDKLNEDLDNRIDLDAGEF